MITKINEFREYLKESHNDLYENALEKINTNFERVISYPGFNADWGGIPVWYVYNPEDNVTGYFITDYDKTFTLLKRDFNGESEDDTNICVYDTINTDGSNCTLDELINKALELKSQINK